MAGTLIQSNLDKIGDFLQDAQYQSLMVNSASYNVRIMRERKARMPFLDSQTGLAQSPVRPVLLARHRLSCCRQHPGQLYRYPAQPWRRRHRSYLARQHQASQEAEASEHAILTVENPSVVGKGLPSTEELLEKEAAFYYDETVGFLEDDEDDLDNDEDDFDDDTYGMRSSKKKRVNKLSKKNKTNSRGCGGSRKRKDASVASVISAGATAAANRTETEELLAKPYECQRCSARYKTRQGLSYHLSHTHKTETPTPPVMSASVGSTLPETVVSAGSLPVMPPSVADPVLKTLSPGEASSDATTRSFDPQDVDTSFKDCQGTVVGTGGRNDALSTPPAATAVVAAPDPPLYVPETSAPDPSLASQHSRVQKNFVATPNPYCDFCLGDSRHNKKTGVAEQMVSCSDCGRSGHPTCLQFTAKMMEAVKRYRWQCIECKCCTLCGTAENDDQLLFCDDCDRGYHLYCVRPPLAEPPEGEWACHLCQPLRQN
ncbi:Zinc finger PHD-finger [Trinorchestia longiramus]|nr:Zinc finger PHD-finger [Trinorchestia longiramus]